VGSPAARFVELALADTDRRVGEDKPVAPSFLLACLLWDEARLRWQALRADGVPVVPALQQAIDAVFDERIGDISGRGKLAADMREIWLMQPRFDRRSGSGPASLVEQPRFRAAFDFLRLRADVDEVPVELAEWWEDYSLGTDEEREALMAAVKPQGGARRVKTTKAEATASAQGSARAAAGDNSPQARTRSGAVSPEGEGAGEGWSGGEGGEGGEGSEGAAPRKRRRRRRRSGEGGGGGTGGAGPAGDAAH
jgi:poly(A) polymerase